jgi:CubicO group peptidase (beta-lactamase class C family)
MNRRRFLARLAGAALVSPRLNRCLGASCDSARSVRRWPAVQRLLDGYVSDRTVAGAGVAISYGGSPLAYPAAGKIAFDSPVSFDQNSLCRMYSITKNVTRIATMLLVEDGAISLDQPVTDVLPEFRSLRVAIDIEKGLVSRPAVKTMTMRHLITDTSGLGNWTPGSDGGDALHVAYRERGITPGNFGARLNRPGYGPQVKNLTEMVERVAELPLAYEPGTVLHYSIGFDVMGLVIERITGKSYDAFLRERLFEPLDMTSTGFEVAPKDAARLTTNYHYSPDGLKVTDPGATSAWLQRPTLLSGGGGLISTARDFARYGAMLLGDGALDGTRIMKLDTVRLALSDLRPASVADPSERVGVGTGAMLQLTQRLKPAGAFGAGGAAGCLFWIEPSRRGNVVFMVQTMGYPLAELPYPSQVIAAIEGDLGDEPA